MKMTYESPEVEIQLLAALESIALIPEDKRSLSKSGGDTDMPGKGTEGWDEW